MDDVTHAFGGQLIAIACIVAISLSAARAVRRDRPWAFGLNPPATCLAIGSAAAIAVCTLTRRANATSVGRIQLDPLHTLRGYINYDTMLVYTFGNIALFVPLGFFIYLALGRGVFASTLLCTFTSVTVEILQLPIWSRSTDIDDVLTNGVGGLGGALAGFVVLRLNTARQARHREQAGEPDVLYGVGSRAS